MSILPACWCQISLTSSPFLRLNTFLKQPVRKMNNILGHGQLNPVAFAVSGVSFEWQCVTSAHRTAETVNEVSNFFEIHHSPPRVSVSTSTPICRCRRHRSSSSLRRQNIFVWISFKLSSCSLTEKCVVRRWSWWHRNWQHVVYINWHSTGFGHLWRSRCCCNAFHAPVYIFQLLFSFILGFWRRSDGWLLCANHFCEGSVVFTEHKQTPLWKTRCTTWPALANQSLRIRKPEVISPNKEVIVDFPWMKMTLLCRSDTKSTKKKPQGERGGNDAHNGMQHVRVRVEAISVARDGKSTFLSTDSNKESQSRVGWLLIINFNASKWHFCEQFTTRIESR